MQYFASHDGGQSKEELMSKLRQIRRRDTKNLSEGESID